MNQVEGVERNLLAAETAAGRHHFREVRPGRFGSQCLSDPEDWKHPQKTFLRWVSLGDHRKWSRIDRDWRGWGEKEEEDNYQHVGLFQSRRLT